MSIDVRDEINKEFKVYTLGFSNVNNIDVIIQLVVEIKTFLTYDESTGSYEDRFKVEFYPIAKDFDNNNVNSNGLEDIKIVKNSPLVKYLSGLDIDIDSGFLTTNQYHKLVDTLKEYDRKEIQFSKMIDNQKKRMRDRDKI